MIKILIVDDSPTETLLLQRLFEHEKDMKIIACAKNGAEAIKLIPLLKPDIITMDIEMPVMDGLEATRIIMMTHPTPIVVISSTAHSESDKTIQALEAGALTVLGKTFNLLSSKKECKRVIDTIRNMSEIKVIKRRFHTPLLKKATSTPVSVKKTDFEIVAIGASVGGPQALSKILSNLSVDFPVPIVVVQHMTEGFIEGFVSWLNAHVALHVTLAKDNEPLVKGNIYFAPDNCHLEIKRTQGKLFAQLVTAPPIAGFCPSVTALLQSVATTCHKKGVGVILTGMGNDGAQGLLALKKAHGHTLIQDKESAVVFGMAGVAESLGAVNKIVELDQIANYLTKICARD